MDMFVSSSFCWNSMSTWMPWTRICGLRFTPPPAGVM